MAGGIGEWEQCQNISFNVFKIDLNNIWVIYATTFAIPKIQLNDVIVRICGGGHV